MTTIGTLQVTSFPLSGLAVGHTNQPHVVQELLFPTVMVPKSEGTYPIAGREALKLQQTDRAPGSTFGKFARAFTSATYTLENHGLEHPIPVEHVDAAAGTSLAMLERSAVKQIVEAMSLRLEIDCCTLATTAANYHANLQSTPGDWDQAAGTPVSDIADAIIKIAKQGGGMANTILFGAYAWKAFSTNSQVMNLWNQATSGTIDVNQLNRLFPQFPNLTRFGVSYSIDTTGTNAFCFDEDAVVVANVATSPAEMGDILSPTYGATFWKSQRITEMGREVATYYDPSRKSNVVQVAEENVPGLIDLDTSSDTVYGYLLGAVDA